MKQPLAFLIILTALATVCAAEPIKIGVSAALTGEAATFGLDIRDVLQFANEELAGGRYQLVIEDDKCSPKDGATVANKLVHTERVKYVLGFACSGVALAAAPIYERGKVVSVVSVASSPKISEAGDYIFRTNPSDHIAGALLAEHVKRRGYRKVAVFSAESEYSQDLREAFGSRARDLGIELIEENYLPSQSDFKSQLLKLRRAAPDAIFVNSWVESDGAVVFKQLEEMGWSAPVLAAYYPSSPAMLRLVRAEMEGVEFVDVPALTEILTEDGKDLYRKYVAKFGELRSNDAFFASTFEAFRALDAAIQSGEDVREYLRSKTFSGIFGPYSFDEKGEIKGFSFVIKTIAAGVVQTLTNN